MLALLANPEVDYPDADPAIDCRFMLTRSKIYVFYKNQHSNYYPSKKFSLKNLKYCIVNYT